MLVGHPEPVGARLDHRPILGLAMAERFLSLLALRLLVQVVESEGDRVGNLLEQARLPVPKHTHFTGIDDEHAAGLTFGSQRHRGRRPQAKLHGRLLPGLGI